MTNKEIWWLTLSCFHGTTSTVEVAGLEKAYCGKCHTARLVVGVVSDSEIYRIRCRNCRYSRRYGIAKFGAVRAAIDHRGSVGHSIDVLRGVMVVVSFAPVVTPSLFGISKDTDRDDDCPF